MKNIPPYFLLLFCSLAIISCSSEDDSALKDGKVAASLSEADQLEPPYISTLTINNSSATTNQTTVKDGENSGQFTPVSVESFFPD